MNWIIITLSIFLIACGSTPATKIEQNETVNVTEKQSRSFFVNRIYNAPLDSQFSVMLGKAAEATLKYGFTNFSIVKIYENTLKVGFSIYLFNEGEEIPKRFEGIKQFNAQEVLSNLASSPNGQNIA